MTEVIFLKIKRGEIYYADLSPVIEMPTHIALKAELCGLPQDSMVMLEQVRTLDKTRLKAKTGEIRLQDMYRVNKALSVSLGLQSQTIRI